MALPEYRAAIAEPTLPKQLTEPKKGQPEPKGYKVVRDKYVKLEKFAITITLFSALVVLLLSLATQVTLSNQNRALQDLQNDSVAIGLENQNLEQEVQELSRYDRIIEIAKELGLEMNEANVRNVTR
ncbi:septum formation initiator family protein [Trichococcus sp. K1Tr]|uniref:septum formation initiator family protein n=1 Tax=Trichococcus sp. K1Tr TaxID=3020847 RepID=UPI00232BB569|nr:septum formation initiator family protein [Trichococcus sp. K1Tr]MDB6352511.1 septum formation initiator family protein [Trichococcus sp. K1Tr]